MLDFRAIRCRRAVAERANLIRYARGELQRITCQACSSFRLPYRLPFPALPGVSALPDVRLSIHFSRSSAMWTKPAYTDLRFGFEITMYISNR
jgi:coenzyme PQQ precursor peptide PqqA